MPKTDSRFAALDDPEFAEEDNGGPSGLHSHDDDVSESGSGDDQGSDAESGASGSEDEEGEDEGDEGNGIGKGMDPSGFAGPSSKIVKPLTHEALAAFKAAQDKAGVVYISRIPPGMRPAKVRHLMSAFGEIGRVYLQQEGTWFNLDTRVEAANISWCTRCQAGVPPAQVHRDEEGSLYRRMGGVQG